MRRCRVRRQDTARKNMRKWRQLPPQVRAKGRVAETVSLLSAVSYLLHLCLSAVPALIGVLGAAQFRVIVFCGTTVHLFKTPKHQGCPAKQPAVTLLQRPFRRAQVAKVLCCSYFGAWCALVSTPLALSQRAAPLGVASPGCPLRARCASTGLCSAVLPPLLHAKTTRLLPLHTVVRCALSARTRARALSRPTAPQRCCYTPERCCCSVDARAPDCAPLLVH